uniref:Uncharacterized protein n=1 Tax=Cacopsylla melanoneura TaxID=428564 RepID=A0A8D8TFY1_9HEMI
MFVHLYYPTVQNFAKTVSPGCTNVYSSIGHQGETRKKNLCGWHIVERHVADAAVTTQQLESHFKFLHLQPSSDVRMQNLVLQVKVFNMMSQHTLLWTNDNFTKFTSLKLSILNLLYHALQVKVFNMMSQHTLLWTNDNFTKFTNLKLSILGLGSRHTKS